MNARWKIAQWFEARWWRRYLKQKPPGEYLNWKRDYWCNFVKKAAITTTPGERLLDAGCGPAGIFTVFPDHQITAVDPLLGTYERELPHFRRSWYPGVRFVDACLEEFKEKEQYHKVFCLNAINHVSDLAVSLQHVADALIPGGKLYLTVDAHNLAVLKYLFRLVPGDILHPHQLDLMDYKKRLAALDLHLEREQLIKQGAIFNYYLLTLKK